MNSGVKVGASVPPGVWGAGLVRKLKLGDFLLTQMPLDFDEAIALAKFCRENEIHFIFSEILNRGHETANVTRLSLRGQNEMVPREDFFSPEQARKVFAEGGKFFLGRMVLGEVGGMLYWPKEYTIDRACGNFLAFPPAKTVQEARDMYLDYMKETVAFERELADCTLLDVDSSMTFKYHLEAGVDIACIESMPGDCDLLYGALRGCARAYGTQEFGAHIAMRCYGGWRNVDRLWLQRWRVSLYFSYLSGATFIYPESGHFGHGRDGFNSKGMKDCRLTLREFSQFANVHTRPRGGPHVRIGFVHGHLDGYPGLWNKYAWGQYLAGPDWLHGPPEWGWDHLKNVYRKEDWHDPDVVGEHDFSGHLPGGIYDVVPIEAPLKVLKRYPCLVFLGWNTMTREIYKKLTEYVEAGGHLLMSVPHLSTHTERAGELKLYRKGDFSELFGVKITGKHEARVTGVKSLNACSIPSYPTAEWGWVGDPKFIGEMTPAKVKLAGGQVLVGAQGRHALRKEEAEELPLLVEYSLGKGQAFLITTWDYPGARGVQEFVGAVLNAVYAGEQGQSSGPLQGRIRVNGSDRVRHAIYAQGGVTTVYLLNTDFDTAQSVTLWLGRKCVGAIEVPPAGLRLAYLAHGLALLPADKFVDVKEWYCKGDKHRITYTSLNAQKAVLVNLKRRTQRVLMGERSVSCASGESLNVPLRRLVDKDRKEFFARDFLDEPHVQWKGGSTPY